MNFIKLSLLLTITVILLSACKPAVTPEVLATASETTPEAVVTRVATSTPSPTFTPTLSVTASSTIEPSTATPAFTVTPTLTSTPVPTMTMVAEFFGLQNYALEKEWSIGNYQIIKWRDITTDWPFASVVTISIPDDRFPRIWVNYVSEVDKLTGTDITGEGHPDLIIHTWTGGAYCCGDTYVYDFGPEPKKILDGNTSECGDFNEFMDLDRDGVYEFMTCDDSFKYKYCHRGPTPRVIMAYKHEQGYTPVSPHFANLYEDDIRRATKQAKWIGQSHTQPNKTLRRYSSLQPAFLRLALMPHLAVFSCLSRFKAM